MAALWLLLCLLPAGLARADAAPSAAQLRAKLAEAEAQLVQAQAREDAPLSNAVASREEIAEEVLTLQQQVRVYQRQIDSLSKLQALRDSRAQLEREAAGWTGMANPPPYSFLLVDSLREQVRSQLARLQALSTMSAAMGQEAQRRKEAFEADSEKLRQANEALEGAGAANPRLVWLRDFHAVRQRLAESRVEGVELERAANRAETEEAHQRLDSAQRQLAEAKRQVAYGAADREQVRVRLAAERQALQEELRAAMPQTDTARQALATATAALAQAQKAQPALAQTELENRVQLCREQSENADLTLQALNYLLNFISGRSKVWESRWALADAGGTEAVRQAEARISKLHGELRLLREFGKQQERLTGEQVFAMQKQLLDPSSVAQTAHYQGLLQLYSAREGLYRRLLWGLEVSDQLLDLWQQDIDDRRGRASWGERAALGLAQLRADAADLWEFELFAVQDTIEVEGQQITGKRSVTLGKVLTALFILVVGLWLATRLSRLLERAVVRRGGIEASAAQIMRRWLLFVVGIVLLMTSMMMVKIPLTVFAFTGGALAIGAGFGMQNLLKNLISGLMLLLERPFKPGDLVEVAGVRGRVVDIGMRSSYLRDGNGIETLIPNSTFIEEKVTNWTLSSQSVRIAVKLGVAYGSSVQEVTDVLLAEAGRHGLVQHKPPPQVLFEDFGADALQFCLYVWVELKPGVDWPLVASDLRHMIYKACEAHGIVMAFAQRDIHVDSAKPLQVRLLREEG